MTEPNLSVTDIERAQERLKGQIVRTPLLRCADLDRRTGGNILVKAECLQVAGAFKFRGAYNRLVQLNAEERARGVIAWSSGNHAQGVAAAAQRLGMPAAIVMPADAPKIKVDNTRRMGAEVILYDRYTQNREEIAFAIARERGATVVPSYDDPHIIAGQGTAGAEIAEQAREFGLRLDAAVIPCGGGGLIAGCALALKAADAATAIYSAEPAGFDDTARSLTTGKRESNAVTSKTICDALMAPEPGRLTFPINQRLLAGGLAVTDEMTIAAIRYAWRELKLVVEPGGAVALAAVLAGLIDCGGKSVAVVLSGGNADAEAYGEWISRAS